MIPIHASTWTLRHKDFKSVFVVGPISVRVVEGFDKIEMNISRALKHLPSPMRKNISVVQVVLGKQIGTSDTKTN